MTRLLLGKYFTKLYHLILAVALITSESISQGNVSPLALSGGRKDTGER